MVAVFESQAAFGNGQLSNEIVMSRGRSKRRVTASANRSARALAVETARTAVSALSAIETALSGIPGLAYTRSLSRNGFSQVTAVFEDAGLRHQVVLVNDDSINAFVAAMSMCAVIVTDSGSIVEEANVLQVPCVTLRFGSDRSETFLAGSNFLAPPIGVAISVVFVGESHTDMEFHKVQLRVLRSASAREPYAVWAETALLPARQPVAIAQ